MHDWKGFVRERLSLTGVGGGAEESIIQELANQLEDLHSEALSRGLSEHESLDWAARHIGDWDELAAEIVAMQPVAERADHAMERIEQRARSRGAGWGWFADLGQDIRFALRALLKARAFTVVTLLSLAVGIGVNAGLFTIVHAVSLEPVPGIIGADRVVELLSTSDGREYEVWSYPDFEDARKLETPIEAMAGWKSREGSLETDAGAERVSLTYASATYFGILGVVPVRGRFFLPVEDFGPASAPVAVMSHRMWIERFAGSDDVVGRRLTVNRVPFTIVGIAPEPFRGHRPLDYRTDLWIPLSHNPWVADPAWGADRGSMWLRVIGRLEASATAEEATAHLVAAFARLEEQYPDTNEGRAARAVPFGRMPPVNRASSWLAVGASIAMALLVLLIICGNVAGMVLARSATRAREIAVRLALGSQRGRLVRYLMAEAVLLALGGGGIGVLLAFWVMAVATPPEIAAALPDGGFRPNGAVLGVSLVVALGSTIVFGLLPALRFSRPDLVSTLKDDTGSGGRSIGRVHRFATSAQTGVALILVVTCTLFLRAIGVMEQTDLGFDPTDVYVARIDLAQTDYESVADAGPFFERLLESVRSRPGVRSATIADGIPLDQVGNFTSVKRDDRSGEEGGYTQVEFTTVGAGFFETVDVPLLEGRGIESSDVAGSDPVVVITQPLAERLWPGEDALGRRLWFTVSRQPHRAYTVVGIVPAVASSRATEDHPHIFVPLMQEFRQRVMLVARGTENFDELPSMLRGAILEADPALPSPEILSSESLVAQSTAPHRSMAATTAGLGLLALLLSAIGVYGVVAYAVTSRTREIGVRMAMGATRERVMRNVIGDAMRLAVPGLAVGAVLSIATAVLLRSLLLGLSPIDPVSFGVAALVLLTVVWLASLLPARRASAINPMEALRSE